MFCTAESPPSEQEFIIVFALLKSLEAPFPENGNQQVVKTHDKQIDIFEKQFKVSVVGLLFEKKKKKKLIQIPKFPSKKQFLKLLYTTIQKFEVCEILCF